jgi:uncharacterized Rmd1/YagE family protein
MIDNVIYTPYLYDDTPSPTKRGNGSTPVGTLIEIDDGQATPTPARKGRSKFLILQDRLADIFVFSYGVVVIWGMTEAQEKRFLTSLLALELSVSVPSNLHP